MPVFEIDQYELHAQTYRIEAASEAEAVKKLLDGRAVPIDDALDYLQVADKYGMSAQDHMELAARLRAFGIRIDDQVIPSIRSIRKAE